MPIYDESTLPLFANLASKVNWTGISAFTAALKLNHFYLHSEQLFKVHSLLF